jgi:hypothetical protein
VDRTRPNHSPAVGNAAGGLDPADGSTILTAPGTVDLGQSKTYLLTPNQGFDQQPGDAILLGFFRRPGSFGDTCADSLIITGIQIKYRAEPIKFEAD